MKICKICNKIIFGKLIKNICIECFESLPSNFDKNIFIQEKRNDDIIKILECEKHGLYLATASREKCPICKNQCIIDGCKNKSYIKGYCLNCLKTLPTTFTLDEIEENKNKSRFKIVPLNCDIHGLYLGFTPANYCPICKNTCKIEGCNSQIYKFDLCKYHFDSIEANFDKNDENEIKNIKKIFLLYCDEHGYYLANSSITNCYKCIRNCICEDCNNIKYNNYKLCKEHLLTFPNNFNCDALYKEWINDGKKIYILKCEKHGNYIAKGPVTSCPICDNKCQIENCENQKVNNCVCKEHYDILQSTFDKIIPPNKICICECDKHGLYLSGSGIGSCPTCYDEELNDYLNKINFIDDNGNRININLENKYNKLNVHGLIIKGNNFYEKDNIINFLTNDRRKFTNFIPDKIIITNLNQFEYIMKIKNIIIENFSNNKINTIIFNNEIHETINLEKFLSKNINKRNF